MIVKIIRLNYKKDTNELRNDIFFVESEHYYLGNIIFYNLNIDFDLALIDILKLGGESNARKIFNW